MRQEDKYLVTKSNRLVEAKYSLSSSELKLFLYVVSQIQPNDLEFRIFSFKVRELAEVLGVSNKNIYDEVKKTLKALVKKTLTIEEILDNKDKKPNYLEVSWFSSAEYRNGVVEIELSKKLEPYLLQLKECFTSYQLINILRLKSKYSIRIYELLKKHEKLKSKTYSIQEIRDILQISNNTYSKYGIFKKKVLMVACSEISKNTDILVELRENKIGRRVESITFNVESKTKKLKTMSTKSDENKKKNSESDKVEEFKIDTLRRVIKPQLTDEHIVAILNVAKWDVAKVIEKYIIVKNSKNIKDIVKLLIDAILKDYKELESISCNDNNIINDFNNFDNYMNNCTEEDLEEIMLVNRIKKKQL